MYRITNVHDGMADAQVRTVTCAMFFGTLSYLVQIKALNLPTTLRFADVALEVDTKPLEERQ
jgi:hypothetical protein